jgi:hypothetical protein
MSILTEAQLRYNFAPSRCAKDLLTRSRHVWRALVLALALVLLKVVIAPAVEDNLFGVIPIVDDASADEFEGGTAG